MSHQHYVIRLNPPRPTFPGDMTAGEGEIMARHAEYMMRFFTEGRIIVYGPVGDPAGAWGLSVIDGDSEDEVRAIAEGDPAITSGLATFDLFPMLAGYVRDEPPPA